MSNDDDNSSSDLIWGIEAIGRALGLTVPQTYHKLRNGHLPARQIGNRWVASRAKLIAAVTEDAA